MILIFIFLCAKLFFRFKSPFHLLLLYANVMSCVKADFPTIISNTSEIMVEYNICGS